jgi:uncharacterized protein (TIGR03437 family)
MFTGTGGLKRMNGRLAGIVMLGTAIWAQPPGGPGGPGGGSGDGIWTRNAAFGEAETFDLCNGHQPGSGIYHHHINPVCLRAQLNDNVTVVSTGRLGTQYAENTTGWTHSPILGWSFDGYPVYGPYGYSNPVDPTSAIKRVQPSFQLRNITQRQTLPDWVLSYEPSTSQNLTSGQYGPEVSTEYPLGRYVQDYDYVAGLGDLDQYNGRFTVTPDYPNGTYAYFVTLASDGAPAFPYIINVQYYGTAGSANVTVASDAVDYFDNGALTQTPSPGQAIDPRLASWYTKGSEQDALAISGFDPSAGASTTWPTNVPSGATVSGGNATPALADTQRVRYDANAVYVNSNNLPSYIIGPWFEATMTAGVFMNWAAASSQLAEITRNPTAPSAKSASGMGPVGMWVNGAAIFNVLDGASYSSSAGADEGGGGISPRATNISAASLERGPLAAGSLVSAYAEFSAALATSTATGSPIGAEWPLTLGGATVTVTDSTGAQLPAGILYASPAQVNYQVPSTAASGPGKVTITSGGTSVSGTINILATYPGIFKASADSLAAAQTVTVVGGTQTAGSVSTAPIGVSSGQVYLILYGTGIGTAAVTATIGGVPATVSYAGPQGDYGGLDQVNLLIPSSLAGAGKVNVIVTANNKPSNPVYVVIQ